MKTTSLSRRCAAALLLTALLPAGAGCAAPSAGAPANAEEAVLATVPGKDLSRITLTQHAEQRLGLQTAKVAKAGGNRLTVPYAAVLYDSQGATWVYTSPEPRVFVRQAITVEKISGDVALLAAGPPAGTAVVTLGAEELFGAEFDTAH